MQVERRVVSQLALAHEKQAITKGSTLKLTATKPSSNDELTKDSEKDSSVPMIKIQKMEKKNKYIDIEMDTRTF